MAIPDPAKLLESWMQENGVNQAEVARRVGLHHTALGRVLSGDRRLGAKFASLIDDLTGRKVPAKSWGDWYQHLDTMPARKFRKSA